jgi:ferredoxin
VKVSVDPDFCAGHGACVVTCPDVFRIGADGYAEVVVDTVPAALEDAVDRAGSECPTGAIVIATE